MTVPTLDPAPLEQVPARTSTPLPLWRLNLLRVGYLFVGGGLALTRWPLIVDGRPRGLAEGTVLSMLVAMSILALLGLRYPQRMLPVLLFEVAWKLIWLGVVALPLWVHGTLDGAVREQAATVLLVVVVMAVVPWDQVFRQYVTGRGEPARR